MKKSILLFALLIASLTSLTSCSSDDEQRDMTQEPSKYKVEISHDDNTEFFTQILIVSLEINGQKNIKLSSNFDFDDNGMYMSPEVFNINYTGEVKDISFETDTPVYGVTLAHIMSTMTDKTINVNVKIYKNGKLIKQQTTALNNENGQSFVSA